MLSNGKKHGASEIDGASSKESSMGVEEHNASPVVLKSKKGVTRQCPVCSDDIPVRLLDSHSQLELEKLEELSREPLVELSEVQENVDTPGAGPSRRGAALRARKSFTSTPSSALKSTSVAEAVKTIKVLQRNRRTRHSRTKEFSRAVLNDLDRRQQATEGPASACPICQQTIAPVEGGETLSEHVDRCLAETAASEAHRQEQMETTNGFNNETYELGGVTRIRLTAITGYAGTGFDIRNPTERDVDDDLDVEGDEEIEFGDAQFDEADILGSDGQPDEDIDVDDNILPNSMLSAPSIDTSDSQQARSRTLRELVAAGNGSRGLREIDVKGSSLLAMSQLSNIVEGQKSVDVESMNLDDKDAINRNLQRKAHVTESTSAHHGPTLTLDTIASAACRICLEAYTDPTCSVTCWHVFCKDCWLRCLGSTKLCPICKHISQAGSLRRVYL